MMQLNISCAVCKGVFKNADTIYSTSCGHIFHYSCMVQWKCKSTSCPVCRGYAPTTHPIYLNFENGLEYENVVKDLQAKLASYEGKNKKNQEEIDKTVKKMDAVKRLYNISEQWRAELEDKIQLIKDQNEKHWEKLANKSEENEMLKTHIAMLEKDDVVSNLNENYKQLVSENYKLKKNLSESETLRITLNQKIQMQEQRLKHVTLELEKQFTESFKKESKPEILESNTAIKPKNRKRVRKPKRNENEKLEEAKNVSVETLGSNLNTNAKIKQKGNKTFHLTQPNDYRIVILDFPIEKLVYPLKDTIFYLASKMTITITSENILNVNVLNQKNRDIRSHNSNKVTLIAEFKDIESKTQFLKFANVLKFDSTTKHIKIKEYIDEIAYRVFMHANKKLRGKVYEYIACKDNKVIAKKKITDIEETVIRDLDHVDTILQLHLNRTIDIRNSNMDLNKESLNFFYDHFFNFF